MKGNINKQGCRSLVYHRHTRGEDRLKDGSHLLSEAGIEIACSVMTHHYSMISPNENITYYLFIQCIPMKLKVKNGVSSIIRTPLL